MSIFRCSVLGLITMLLAIALSGCAQSSEQDSSLSSSTVDACDEIGEISRVIEDFWRLSEAGDFEAAKLLRTDTSDGFTIVVEGNVPPWERVIAEIGLEYIRRTHSECKTEGKARIFVLVRNRHAREMRLVHQMVRTESGWRINSISL